MKNVIILTGNVGAEVRLTNRELLASFTDTRDAFAYCLNNQLHVCYVQSATKVEPLVTIS